MCAFGADWAGLHYMVGAFIEGGALNLQLSLLEARVLGVLAEKEFPSKEALVTS